MPKIKKAYDPWERYRGAVLGRMVALDYGTEELAVRMGISPPTVRRYIREPGTMQMDTMRKLNRVLDIEAEQARAYLAVK